MYQQSQKISFFLGQMVDHGLQVKFKKHGHFVEDFQSHCKLVAKEIIIGNQSYYVEHEFTPKMQRIRIPLPNKHLQLLQVELKVIETLTAKAFYIYRVIATPEGILIFFIKVYICEMQVRIHIIHNRIPM